MTSQSTVRSRRTAWQQMSEQRVVNSLSGMAQQNLMRPVMPCQMDMARHNGTLQRGSGRRSFATRHFKMCICAENIRPKTGVQAGTATPHKRHICSSRSSCGIKTNDRVISKDSRRERTLWRDLSLLHKIRRTKARGVLSTEPPSIGYMKL